MTEPIDDARGVRCHISCRAAENMDAFKWTPRYTRRRKTTQFKNLDDSWKVLLIAEHDQSPGLTRVRCNFFSVREIKRVPRTYVSLARSLNKSYFNLRLPC